MRDTAGAGCSAPAPGAVAQSRLRRWVLVLWVVGMVLAVLIVRHLEWLLVLEWKRMPPLTAALSWSGDVAALLGFCYFGVRHGLLGHPLRTDVVPRSERALVLYMICSFATDVSVTGYTMYTEWHGYAHGIGCQAQTVKLERREWTHQGDPVRRYQITYRYTNPRGGEATGLFCLNSRYERVTLGPTLSPEMERAILHEEQVGFPLPVCYDPEWPARSWLAAEGWWRHENWAIFQMLVCCGQLMVMSLYSGSGQPRHVPQPGSFWHGIFPVVPFLAQLLMLGLAGLLPEFNAPITFVRNLP